MSRGFWEKFGDGESVVALSAMDGVTDAAFRYIVCKHSRPSFTMTEFTNVEGLARGAASMLTAFIYHESERPVVAQIYGVEVDSFYKCTVMLCEMGFDGVDINMGCPANKVAKRGSGAGLIKTPRLAREIVRACKKASRDWAEGITLEEAGVAPEVIERIRKEWPAFEGEKREVPVSVKTRVGFDEIVVEEWVKHLLEERPANISMHGRTLRQMYMGLADWDAIAAGARVCEGSGVSYMGNGDIHSMEQAEERIRDYGLDGVLVGRATFGNPWFFGGKDPSLEDRLEVCLEHARYFVKLNHLPFHNIKKHLAWYCKGFDGAKELRRQLMKTESLEDVEGALLDFKL